MLTHWHSDHRLLPHPQNLTCHAFQILLGTSGNSGQLVVFAWPMDWPDHLQELFDRFEQLPANLANASMQDQNSNSLKKEIEGMDHIQRAHAQNFPKQQILETLWMIAPDIFSREVAAQTQCELSAQGMCQEDRAIKPENGKSLFNHVTGINC